MDININNEAILLNKEILWAERDLHLAERELFIKLSAIQGQYEHREERGIGTSEAERRTFYYEIARCGRRIETAQARVEALPTFTNL